MYIPRLAIVLVLLLAGCGDPDRTADAAEGNDSAVDYRVDQLDPGKLWDDMTTEEQEVFCEWLIESAGGSGTLLCDGQVVPELPFCLRNTIAIFSGCGSTIGEVLTCERARLAVDFCEIPSPECDPITACRDADI